MEYYILASDLGSDTKISDCKFYKKSQISENADKVIKVLIPDNVKFIKRKDYKVIVDSNKTINDVDHDIMFKFDGKWKSRNDLELPLFNAQRSLIEEGYHYSFNGFTKTLKGV